MGFQFAKVYDKSPSMGFENRNALVQCNRGTVMRINCALNWIAVLVIGVGHVHRPGSFAHYAIALLCMISMTMITIGALAVALVKELARQFPLHNHAKSSVTEKHFLRSQSS